MTQDDASRRDSDSLEDDSFDAVLKRVAHVSGPAPTGLAIALSAGSVLLDGRLRIVRRIGEGGMGVVYEAYDTQRRSSMALKTLSRLDAAGVYRLKNEFRSLSEVSHEGLCRLHELFGQGGQWFFTMELIDGERFDRWVRPAALDEGRLRAALRQLVASVSAIHAAGKLHRDLKPSNVLVTPQGRVVVLDFGLAVDPDSGGVGQTLADDSVSGTPAYMAPEQAAGQGTTTASDFYALGVMLYEALTGQLPFSGRAHELLVQKQHHDAPRADTIASAAPADLVELCAQLLARDPAKRPDAQRIREVIGADAATPLASRVSSHPAPAASLVGRGAELAALRAAFASSSEGEKPVVVLLSGESGIGKSALLDAFLGELREQGHAVVLSGRCYERESVPFKGFDVLIDELSRHLRKLTSVETASLMPREVYALRRLFPVLGRIEAIAQAPDRTIADAFELRRRAFLALGELLGRLRDRRPVVLAIDDLQWSDVDSTTLLLHLLRQPDAPRVLLVASHRAEAMEASPVLAPLYQTLLVDVRLDVRRLVVGPLPEAAAAALVSNPDDEVTAALVREAGGNPFLLRELSRADQRTRGRSLAEILRARIAKLPAPARMLLEMTAVAARPLPLEVLAQVAGARHNADAAFDVLRAAQLARSAPQHRSIECYHDKVREAVASGLGAELVRAHHAALAAVLAPMPDADPEHLAMHFEQAGQVEPAALYAAQAADRALSAFAFDQAARLYDKALRLGSFAPAEAQRLQVSLGDALAHAGRGAVAAEAYLRAAQTADTAGASELKLLAAEQYLRSGRLERARTLLSEALRPLGIVLPTSPGSAVATLAIERARLRLRGLKLSARKPDHDTQEQMSLLFRLVSGLASSDPLYLAALNGQMLRRALDAGDARTAVLGLQWEIWNRSLGLGGVGRVPELAKRAQVLVDELDDPYLAAWQEFMLACYEAYGDPRGDLESALARIDRFLTVANAERPLLSTYERSIGQYHRINLLTMLGRFGDLARELPAVVDDAWQRSDLVTAPMFMGVPSHAWLAVDATAEVLQELARVEQAWVALDNPYAFQDTALHYGRVSLLHYLGESRRAWEACVAHDERFRSSFASKATLAAGTTHHFRGMAAATLAAQTTDAAERRALIAEAESAPLLLRATASGRRWLILPRTAAACALGDRERAIRLLRAADWSTRLGVFGNAYKHAARRRLGALIGGDEGSSLIAEADAALRAGGSTNPERLVAALLPGCEIR